MMNKYITALLLLFPLSTIAQPVKKPLDHSTYDTWNTVRNVQVSNDGEWVSYRLQPGQGDATLKIYDRTGTERGTYERPKSAAFTWDSKYLVWKIVAPFDSVKAMRRRKVEKKDLPKDTLAALDISSMKLDKIPNIMQFSLPKEWSGHLAYLLAPMPAPEDTTVADSLRVAPIPNNEENGHTLVLRDLDNASQDTFKYVIDYHFSKYNNQLFFQSGGDSTFAAGIYRFDCKKGQLHPLFRQQASFKKLCSTEQGDQVAFLADTDTIEQKVKSFDLYHWSTKMDSAMLALDTSHTFVPSNWLISEYDSLYFSENGARLFFGLTPRPQLPDTTLLEEEIVNVEVWNYQDERLYTQQNVELNEDKRKAYRCWFDTKGGKFVQLTDPDIPEILLANEGNAYIAVGFANQHYQKLISWEGFPIRNDIYQIELFTGEKRSILKNVRSYQYGMSPQGQYFYWVDTEDSCWHVYDFEKEKSINITQNIGVSFTREVHDAPTPPYPYGIAGWTEDDGYLLIYDRYDIWKVDPRGKQPALNLTNGRNDRKVFRYLKLDPRQRWIDTKETLLLHSYNEVTRAEGYANLNFKHAQEPTQLIEQAMHYRRPTKALESDQLVFTRQDFRTFPDLLQSDMTFAEVKQISNANPQQEDYRWGTAEIVRWTSLDGKELEGMLFKPDGFDPDKKYPMIVNFYEKSSTELHDHSYPRPERSTINYALYVSNGYLIFNPDVHYRIGYPGESCYNSVIPGVTKLIDAGFVDEDRIGVQGHSWGGYQIAYLVTKTDMFAAAEAGAPVPNMISAYGGIRWWTGLSRMFQYEHTQSRIGGTLWEYPLRFIENSPIFFVDKINTPLLIMHNDADGHVPWYQGIELFVAMRRLNKPSWMLNYPGEPHWPLKRQNQVDFNIRLMQYFDHYLKDAPQPVWMKKGVPATMKDIDLGYGLEE
jgi:hypothetical protein